MFTLYSCNIFFKCTLTRHLFSLTLKYFFFYKSSKSKKKTKPSSSEIIKTQRKQVNRSAKTKKGLTTKWHHIWRICVNVTWDIIRLKSPLLLPRCFVLILFQLAIIISYALHIWTKSSDCWHSEKRLFTFKQLNLLFMSGL